MLPKGGLRQVALNTKAVPLQRIRGTNGGTRLIHQRHHRDNGFHDRFATLLHP